MNNSVERTEALPEEDSPDYTRVSTRSYAKALEAVQEAAKAQGFRVLSVHDLAASMREKGIERGPYAVVEVCNAPTADAVLRADVRFGALMPCRIAVYDANGRTMLTTVLPTHLMRLCPTHPDVEQAAARVDTAVRAMIDAAVRP